MKSGLRYDLELETGLRGILSCENGFGGVFGGLKLKFRVREIIQWRLEF